jgi:tetratricopeptide (TPR) repeat protein
MNKNTTLLSLILIALLGFAVYGNSLTGKFIWDDEHFITDNEDVRSLSNIGKVFIKDEIVSAGKPMAFYRPLHMALNIIDYAVWELDERGYHLTNIILHILAALCVYWLFCVLLGSNFLPLIIGVLFVIHPVHTEAVSYISGRADPLSLLFMLLCFIFYVKSGNLKHKPFYLLAVTSFLLALFSRENTLILPLLLVLYHYSFKDKLTAKRFLPICAAALFYIILRVFILSAPAAVQTTFTQRIPGFFAALAGYVRLLFLPFNLHMEYGAKLFKFGELGVIAGVFIFCMLLMGIVRWRRKNNFLFFSLGWFLIALLPVSNLYPLNAYMAEHWLYIPSIGCFLLWAYSITFLFKRNKIFSIGLLMALIVFYSYLTIKQNTYWSTPSVFYERILKYAPASARVYNNLANAYDDNNLKLQAISAYKKAIELEPNYSEAYHNLAKTYYDINKMDESIAAYKKAIEISPRYAKAYYNLGIAYEAVGKTSDAVTSYKKAIEIKPNYSQVYNNLGILYSKSGKNEDAIPLFKKAVKFDPNNARAYSNLGIAYTIIGNKVEAIAAYEKAIELAPGHAAAYNNMGIIYKESGELTQAIKLFKKAVEVDAGYATAHFNLSSAYFDNKQYDMAVKHCDAAIKFGYNVSPEFMEKLEPYRK